MSELVSEKLARQYREAGDIERAQKWESLARVTRADLELEPFTAVADCPNCGTLAVHWLEEPRLMPIGDDPKSKAMRSITALHGFYRRYDIPGCSVARVCVKCEHRWGQK